MSADIPIAGLATAIVVLWLTVGVVRTVYDVYFGPLSKFPGPKLAAATRLISSRYKMQGTEFLYTHQLHMKYGPIVRLGPNELSFTDARAWKEITGQYSGMYNGVKTGQFPKDPTYYGYSPPGYLELMNASDVDHARMRRNFSHAFSEKAVRSQEPLVRRHVDELVTILQDVVERTPGNSVDLVKYYSWCTFDITGDLAAGEPLNCLSNAEPHPWASSIFGLARMIPWLQEANCYPWFALFLKVITPASVQRDFTASYRYATEMVNKRLELKESRPDLLGIAMEAKEEYLLTKPEMYGNTKLFMGAGTETSASLLSGLTYYLVQNPSKLSKLTHEVRSTYNSLREMNLDNLAQLKYLNACLNEGLRIYPPAAGSLPRLVPKGGATVCGESIPEDVVVYVHPYSAYHSPRNFKDSEDFVPERWLEDPEYKNDSRDVLQPFSTGPRNCIGKNLAWLEIRMIVAYMVWNFDMSLSPECQDWLNQKVFLIWEKNPLPINLKVAAGQFS